MCTFQALLLCCVIQQWNIHRSHSSSRKAMQSCGIDRISYDEKVNKLLEGRSTYKVLIVIQHHLSNDGWIVHISTVKQRQVLEYTAVWRCSSGTTPSMYTVYLKSLCQLFHYDKLYLFVLLLCTACLSFWYRCSLQWWVRLPLLCNSQESVSLYMYDLSICNRMMAWCHLSCVNLHIC